MESERVLSTYPKIIFFGVSTHMETVIPTTSRKGFFEVAYLSRSVFLCLCSSLAYYISHCVLFDRHIPIYLYHLHHLTLSVMKMKMVRQENSNASRVHRGKRQSVMLRIFLEWMAKLLHGQLHMLLFWYVSITNLFQQCLIITLPLSWPSI